MKLISVVFYQNFGKNGRNNNFSMLTRPAVTDPQQAKEKIQNIRGTLVVHPLEFLKEETKISTFSDLLKNPSMALSKEGMAQWFAGHLFE